ncbi:MAG: hypothetical protein KIS74_10795 [Burkholderiales bacterium]|nr:hypothetical protein [Burkholderiales bacterium]
MRPRVLNVGGSSKSIPIPAHYEGWEHHLLDIDAAGGADIVCDARRLGSLPAGGYSAIYCSHNLEHYFRHELASVLSGFMHVLSEEGFAEIRVPDMRAVFEEAVRRGLDVDDVLYQSPAGPITVNDVVYGYGRQIAQTGQDYYAHKNGFTQASLVAALRASGFASIYVERRAFEIAAIAFKRAPTEGQRRLLGLPAPRPA